MFIICAVTAVLYLSFVILNYKDEVRLLQESAVNMKQKQDNLAAQLQVAQEHKSRLQSQVDQGVKGLQTAKEKFEEYRLKLKAAQDKAKIDSDKKYDEVKRSLELTKNELDDLNQDHAKLLEANKVTMEECETQAEEKNKVIEGLKGQREVDKAVIAKETEKRESKIAALESVNADLTEKLTKLRAEINKLKAETVSKGNLAQKSINSQANDVFLHSPVNQTKDIRKSDVITKKLDAAVNTDRQSHNLQVPSVDNDAIDKLVLPAHPRPIDHKDIQNVQIAKPMAVQNLGPEKYANDVQSQRMVQLPVIPKDQENIQIPHPWAKQLSHESHDSGFKVVGQPVLPEPRIGDGREAGGGRNIPSINNNLGVLAQPNFGGDDERSGSARVIPQEDRNRQGVAPNLGVQVDNPLEAEGNPNSLHQPQLQLNAPDGDVNGDGLANHNDDDEDHAFGNDKDYGAGALDKPDRGNLGGAVDGAAVVGAAPPDFDEQKINGLNVDFKKRKRKFA